MTDDRSVRLVAMIDRDGTPEIGPMPELPDPADGAAWEEGSAIWDWAARLVELIQAEAQAEEEGRAPTRRVKRWTVEEMEAIGQEEEAPGD